MGSLMGSLYVGNSGIVTAQNALNTTAHNLANTDTEGYTRQQVSLGTRFYITNDKNTHTVAWTQIGLGVTYNECKQVRSTFLDQSYRKEYGRQEFYDVSKLTLEEIEDQLQEMNGAEFANALANLWTSVQELVKNPTAAVNQSTLVTRANEFLTQAQSVYTGLTNYQSDMDATITTMVKRINDIGDRISELNQKIVKIESGNQEHANDLRDERNVLLDELASYGKISYQEDIFGNVLCQFEGTQFIMTDHVNHMAVDKTLESSVGYSTPYWEFASKSYYNSDGEKVVTDISGAKVYDLTQTVSTQLNTDIGKLRATLLARGDHNATYHDIAESTEYYNSTISQSIIMNVEAEFDMLVHNIISKINEIYEEAGSNPANLDPTAGSKTDYDLFTIDDTEACIIYDMVKMGGDVIYEAGTFKLGSTIMNTSVNDTYMQTPTTMSFILADGSEDTETVQKLQAAFEESIYTLNPNVETTSDFLTYYNNLVSQVANSGSIYNNIYASQEQTVNSVASAREQIVGVSNDEELEFMIEYQNAYNASSRYINVISEMIEHIITQLGNR
jgi:flagellar hook-associated protein 1 FlgK